jgi:carboxyl-terminal processing protease
MKKILQTLTLSFSLLLMATSTSFAQLDAKDRIEVLDKVWKTINKKYHDPNFNGLDWNKIYQNYRPKVEAAKDDAQAYALVKQMVGELGDIHTSFRTPRDVQAGKLRRVIGVGLKLGEAEGKIVIFGVAPDSDAARAGLQPGMVLTNIDGRDATDVLAETRSKIKSSSEIAINRIAYARLLSGAENTEVRLNLIDSNGQPKEITLVRQAFDPEALSESKFESRRLASGKGYIRFDEFNDSMLKKYKKALTEFKDTEGLIIDLRFNYGGSHYTMEEMAEPFFSEKVSFGTTKTRTGKIPKFLGISLIPKETFVGDEGGRRYTGAIVILISNYSASSAEHFAAGMQESGRAKIIGERSCGCMLGIFGKVKIKGGAELYVSELDFLTAQGKRIEGAGVTPDITIAPLVSDVPTGFSRIIIEAEKLLEIRAIDKTGEVLRQYEQTR